MPLLDYVLRMPSYGWMDEQGLLIKPTNRQLLNEYFSRLNVFKSRQNWMSFYIFTVSCILLVFFILSITYFISWWTLIAFVFGSFSMSVHQTIWFHRYCTHRAFIFRNGFWRFITQNLTIKFITEEIYAISHHVHHAKSDEPGDPYNATAGWLYCYLASTNHQALALNLNERSYKQVKRLMKHTGIHANSYAQYQRWGSYTSPWRTVLACVLNFSFWYAVYYFIGGHFLAISMFGVGSYFLAVLRLFNYFGHDRGENWHRKGRDFNAKDLSVNLFEYGILAGEWHNNHHLYPNSARSGFKPGQIDLAWYYIKLLSMIGAVTSYKDSKAQFYEKYYTPYLKAKQAPEEELIGTN